MTDFPLSLTLHSSRALALQNAYDLFACPRAFDAP
jgi:hypothetical protein